MGREKERKLLNSMSGTVRTSTRELKRETSTFSELLETIFPQQYPDNKARVKPL
jgi:hypothetical protein